MKLCMVLLIDLIAPCALNPHIDGAPAGYFHREWNSREPEWGSREPPTDSDHCTGVP